MASAIELDQNSLPIIDIAPLLDKNDVNARLSASAALHDACVKYGFFYLNLSSYIDPSEPENLVELARRFFSLPQDQKEVISLSKQDYARGYARLKENVTNGKADNHEGIDFYHPVQNPDKTKPLWGENQWPTIPDFKESYDRWIVKMKKLGMIVMEAMAAGLGMRPEEWGELRKQVDDSFWVLRIIGYPPLPNEHDGFSCGAHKDYGCLTLLYADPTPSALQVFIQNPGVIKAVQEPSDLPAEQGDNEEGMWLNVDPIPGHIVCNIGEMWEIWTNGLYKSTLHRVIHRGSNYRVSIPFFFEPNFDAHVQPLEAALRIQQRKKDDKMKVDSEKRYKPVVYGQFLLAKVGNNFAQGRYRDT